MKIEFSQNIFEKYSNIKFHENPSGGNRVVPLFHMDRRTDRQTDIMNLTATFNNFANAPKILNLKPDFSK